ncbi:MAG: hypothetical protein ACOYMG_05095 [Candidatus Methylumidiphilus sp.]
MDANLDMDIEDSPAHRAPFTKSLNTDKVIFESTEPIALSEQLNSFTLVVQRDGSKFVEKKLPNPDNGIPLKKNDAGKWVSEVNVYV